MKKELLFTLMILFVFSFSRANRQVWDHPFFEINIPSTWRNMTPVRDIETPVRELDSIKIYKDVRLTPMVDGGQLSVEVFEHRNGYKLNYKDFLDFLIVGNVINERFIKVYNLKCHQREQITEVEYRGKMLFYFNTVWHIQGDKRVYRFTWGSYDEKVYNEELGFVEKLLNSFSEKP